MDIRFINKKDEIINASELSIKAMGSSLIGINAEQKIVEIERYGSEEEAREILRGIGKYLEEDTASIVIDLRSEEE